MKLERLARVHVLRGRIKSSYPRPSLYSQTCGKRADALGRIPYLVSSPAESMLPGAYDVRALIRQGGTAGACVRKRPTDTVAMIHAHDPCPCRRSMPMPMIYAHDLCP